MTADTRAEFVRVLESVGQLCKLKMPFSRTWKAVGKGTIFKMAMEQFWIFVWKNSKYIA